jgi:N-acetylneuraminic acid mutarotase
VYSLVCVIVTISAEGAGCADRVDELPANRWILLHDEDPGGGKAFSQAIYADHVGRVYLWGIGGEKPARNVYRRYELESFDIDTATWKPAFPVSTRGRWAADDYPPFRILGQSGPDGLGYDEGPRLQVVGGYHATNRVKWWDFDGVQRPSPIHTFNMACWDSKRDRALYYSDSCTFALDPATNTWTDLKTANHPTTGQVVAWASMCYDAANDRAMLFGGGLATNPSGALTTWYYDCHTNMWRRPELFNEPPPRCNGALVCDGANQAIVLFGGYDQSGALNDTWIFDMRTDRWERREPEIAPPPMFSPAAAAIPGGRKILVCGYDARKVRWLHQTTTSAVQETWVYDIATNVWTPLDNDLCLPGYRWLTATTVEDRNLVLLVAFGSRRRTFAFRYDEAVARTDLPGAPPGTIAWKYPEQKTSLEQAQPADVEKHAEFLASLPPNKFVDASPPGLLISKTWSTAIMDTDDSAVIYIGGGHSGYSGNDVARYSVAGNRWTLDTPPRFPPYLEGTNAGIFGWSYGMLPFSQHTYLWYCYDPVSRMVIYLARPSLRDEIEVQLTDDPADTFVYTAAEHGYASWCYDPTTKKMHRPCFGRPFGNTWHLSLVGTPKGVFAATDNRLFRGEVNCQDGSVTWELADEDFPKPEVDTKYHYEFQPLLLDSKRERLIQLKGNDERVDVFARALHGSWRQLETTGQAAIGREAVYIARHDTILWLGNALYALECQSNTMQKLDVALPQGLLGHECALVYDPRQDVCVALIPQRFSGPMQTFLFRFQPARLGRD